MSLPVHWVNGEPGASLSVSDRGFSYGDSLFETFRIHRGRPQLWRYHLERLQAGQRVLGIDCDTARIETQVGLALEWLRANEIVDAAARLTLSRGPAARGYRSAADQPTLSLSLDSVSPWRSVPDAARVKLCETPLARQPALAGIKHGNRLEQVLASRELQQADEGLQSNDRGELVCGVSSNLFLVRGGQLLTPAIVDCGIAGTVRRAIIEDLAPRAGLDVVETSLQPDGIIAAEEMFLTNALLGIRQVACCGEHVFTSSQCGDNLREDFFLFSESSE